MKSLSELAEQLETTAKRQRAWATSLGTLIDQQTKDQMQAIIDAEAVHVDDNHLYERDPQMPSVRKSEDRSG